MTRSAGSAGCACCRSRQDRLTAAAGSPCPWTTHNLLLLDWGRSGTCTGTQQAMNAAIGGILRAFGYAAEPSGSGGAWLVTGRHRQEAEAGR